MWFGKISVPLEVENRFNNQPSAFVVSPAFPNPFNSTTQVKFSVIQPTYVQMRLYNLHGAIQEDFSITEFFTPGYHSFPIDASDLSTGLYFVTLSTGDISLTKSMYLIR